MEVNVLENEVVLRNPQEVEVFDKEVGWENTQDIDVLDKEDIYVLYKEVFLENIQEEVILENTQEERVGENPQPLPSRLEVNEITDERKNEAEAKGVETELKNKWWKAKKKRLLEQHVAGSFKNMSIPVESQFNHILHQVEKYLKTRMKRIPQKERRLLRSYRWKEFTKLRWIIKDKEIAVEFIESIRKIQREADEEIRTLRWCLLILIELLN